jgi:hypothetical protein
MNHDHNDGHAHDNMSWYDEIICHLPYAILSVAFAIGLISVLGFMNIGSTDEQTRQGAHLLFHGFHFLHIIFAATGTVLTFFRFSNNLVRGVLVGSLAPMFFCTLSDVVLPYLGGRLLNVPMHLHLCFITELHNVLPFLIVGMLNGYLMSKYHAVKQSLYSVFSHFFHILISSLAATFYLVAHGLIECYSNIGIIFVFLIIAVIIPCTLADLVVPMAFARAGNKHEKHKA